jgi:multidrug efflux pump subunit AcrB
MFLAVAFAVLIAYLVSLTFVPTRCAKWLKSHGHKPVESHTADYEHRNEHENAPSKGPLGVLYEKWESLLDGVFKGYARLLAAVMEARLLVIGGSFAALAAVVVLIGPHLRREFFPEVDAGSFEIYVRAGSGTRIEVTEGYIEAVEKYVKAKVGADTDLVVSELGLNADWSAAFTPNSGPMDAVVKVQLTPEREKSAQEYVALLRDGFATDPEFERLLHEVYQRKVAAKELPEGVTPLSRVNLEFAFDAGGMIRSAMNEGKSTPLNVKVTGKNLPKTRKVAEAILAEVRGVDGVVDARIIQRLNYPLYIIDVNREKAESMGLNQTTVMKNVIAAFNSSVQFNKKNFWIDPVSHNQYYVGVSYPEDQVKTLESLLDIPITTVVPKGTSTGGKSGNEPKSIPLRNVATLRPAQAPSEVVHTNLQPTIDLTMGVAGRDLGHVAADVSAIVARHGQMRKRELKIAGFRFTVDEGTWTAFDPDAPEHKLMEGARISLSGEYQKMQTMFLYQAGGMAAAVVLIYFLLVALFRSYIVPLVVLSAVPVGVIGVVLVLFFTGTALNVQSLLGVIFMVGIVVSNTVLLTEFAINLQKREGLSPAEAIRRAGAIRVRPVVMTALATFFALIPMALGLERGSEANVPLGRAVLGGLVAGLLTTLFVVPCVYSLVVPTKLGDDENEPLPGDPLPETAPTPASGEAPTA